ncbi:MAG: M24 family metallopeptidase [Candidatus Hodarchaeota archaeon]
MSYNYAKVHQSEIDSRTKNLQKQLEQEEVDGALFLSTPELYYYSGIGSDGAVYVPIEGDPIYLIKRNLSLAKKHSLIANVQIFGRQSKLFETLEIKSPSRIMIEKDVLSASYVNFLHTKVKDVKLIDGSHVFRKIRSVKSAYEIELIERAANLVDQSFEYCIEIANPDMTEIELASQLDSWLLHRGHGGYITTRAFNAALLHYSYVISSRSSTMNIHFTPISGGGLSLKYPYGPSRQKLGKNSPFFVDTCGNNQGYISDTTRTFICGHFDEETQNQLEALSQVKEFLRKKLGPKINLGDLYYEIMDLSKELKIYDYFMGTGSDKSAFLGHGVGLELDELPILYPKGSDLLVGNILACEPKFFALNQKVLGIEDTYSITDSGNKILSKSRNSFEI